MAVTLAIALAITVLAYTAFRGDKPRAALASAAADLQSLLHQARQTALGTGDPVAVLIYPAYAPPAAGGVSSTGYAIVYQDACFDFFTATAPTCGVRYATYNPAAPATGANGTLQSVVIDTVGLPRGVVFGPATGMGAAATLAAPLNAIPVNKACSFCGTTGGAVVFDPTGKATFYQLDGTNQTGPLNVTGGSLSLGYDANYTNLTGQRTVLILSISGAVQTISNG
jgi:Tfp pilus assembly protein FimT